MRYYLLRINLFLIILSLQLNAQNLVVNPSFEEGRICPDNYSELYKVKGWEKSNSSTDYFNVCGISTNKELFFGVPQNSQGYQFPKSGNAYAGFLPGTEELQTKLISPLFKDSVYLLIFYLSLADSSNYSTWSIGAALIDKELNLNKFGKREVLSVIPQVQNKMGNYIDSKTEWVKLFGYFKANGNEQYLIIGSFSSLDEIINTAKILTKSQKRNCYYYLDDISLEKITLKPNEYLYQNKIISAENAITLNNILFENGKYNLLQESYKELDKLVDFLNTNNVKIEISGYTDNIGDKKTNMDLSEKRAKSIAEYLISKGIDKSRILCKGYGEIKQVTDNSSDEKRRINRRVEFKILKN